MNASDLKLLPVITDVSSLSYYRPPNSATLYNTLIADFIGLAVDTNSSDIIIIGDFNYNVLNPGLNLKVHYTPISIFNRSQQIPLVMLNTRNLF